jgi:predicted RecB family nuclease
MKKLKNGHYLYSPSDLVRYIDSPFASAMARLVCEGVFDKTLKNVDDEQAQLLANRGFNHEDDLEAVFRSQGKRVIKIKEDTKDNYEQTLAAMREGYEVIVQAYLTHDLFAGYADFLIKVDGKSRLGDYHYEVWDTKLAHHIKPAFVIQLCCYAEMLCATQGVLPKHITVALGNRQNISIKTLDCFAYYQAVKSAFLQEQAQFNIDVMPDPADSKNWGQWSDYAQKTLKERDHLFQVANISYSQIKKLNQAGINTMTELTQSPVEYIKGIQASTLQRLKKQASLQKQSIGLEKPKFEIIRSPQETLKGLALLPPHSTLDIFFDIEGFPYEEGGLEYLWGATYFNPQNEIDFKAFWAHNREQEKQAFEAFITWAFKCWQDDPSMHIYHYAAYEVTVCRKLMGRFGVCEFEVDQLLRNDVFVDLYKIVKGGLLVGESKYSIKNIESLYRKPREGEVANGGDSIVAYDTYKTLSTQVENQEAQAILNNILAYNKEDCDSTQELVVWLRQQQKKHDIAYMGKIEIEEAPAQDDEKIDLRNKLLAQAEEVETNNIAQGNLLENLAWMLEFHKREAKPVFWRLFDRLGLSDVELFDDLECLAGCQRTKKAEFTINRTLAYEYSFDRTQEFKDASKYFYVLGLQKENKNQLSLELVKEYSDLKNGLITVKSSTALPKTITLIPNDYVNPNPIPLALQQVISDITKQCNTQHVAIQHFLQRQKPVIKGHKDGAIVSSKEPQQRLDEIIDVVERLNNSYLVIQGPPGSGKSYTAKHIIAKLIKNGAKVGISSNSHKAINHLLLTTAQYCAQQQIEVSFVCTKNTAVELEQAGITISTNNQLINYVKASCVLGTTAWGFARKEMANQLDYIFVDEAGQVSVANLIAMSRSAKNLVLMGDQMQLGQPSQGTHPLDSGLSVLDYLLHDTPTIADDMGVFLSESYRMHPAVNQFISEYIYEAKLHTDSDNVKQLVHVPASYTGILNKGAGIVFVSVEHQGNTQAADEEVEQIVQLTQEILQRQLTTKDGVTRQVTWQDILFIAPYNHQVSKLQAALGQQAKVGSVDKFQGQEAHIVFLSMCSSDASEALRGLDFLFNKNRLNVAISRAKSLAIVVANPRLAITKVNSIEQLKMVNLFSALIKTRY